LSTEPDAAQRAALGRLEALRTQRIERGRGRFWQRWTRPFSTRPAASGSRGLYLYGPVGRGKTMLMDLFYDSLRFPQRRRSHFHHFMRDVHERLSRISGRRAPLERVGRELASKYRVLCLDELFVSDIADAMILGALFEALLRHGVVLVITSNVAPAGLYPDGLQRSRFLPTIALLERELELCRLDGGTDYRLQQLKRAPIYLDSHAADTAACMQRLFNELAGDHGEWRTGLVVLGRTVAVIATRADVVWFEFAAICASSRSQNDYVELAQEFRTVMISHVPVFEAPEQDDAARRFIALVDEFYDQGTKLVVSAAAAPLELYRRGRLRAEFDRTASRLVEMQSLGYLARARRG
jgi:cell division protein ZapE